MNRYEIGWWPPRDEWPFTLCGVFGTRENGWADPDAARTFTRHYVDSLPADAILVSGRSPKGGVDIWAEERWDETRDPSRKRIFVPETRGAASMLFRNKLIVSNMDRGVGIWNGWSRGTKYTADLTAQVGKPVLLFTLE